MVKKKKRELEKVSREETSKSRTITRAFFRVSIFNLIIIEQNDLEIIFTGDG